MSNKYYTLFHVDSVKIELSIAEIKKAGIIMHQDIEFWVWFEANNVTFRKNTTNNYKDKDYLNQDTQNFLLSYAQLPLKECSSNDKVFRSAAIYALEQNFTPLLINLSSKACQSMDFSAKASTSFNDVRSEADIAFLEAIMKFVPGKSMFFTFAYTVVENALKEKVHSRKYDTNPYSKSKRKLLLQFDKFCDDYYLSKGCEATDKIICDELHITPKTLKDIKVMKNNNREWSIDAEGCYSTHSCDSVNNPGRNRDLLVGSYFDCNIDNIFLLEMIKSIPDIFDNYDTAYMTSGQKHKFNRNIEIFYYCFNRSGNHNVFTNCSKEFSCSVENARKIYNKMLIIVREGFKERGYI